MLRSKTVKVKSRCEVEGYRRGLSQKAEIYELQIK